jgi:hypothetical protein
LAFKETKSNTFSSRLLNNIYSLLNYYEKCHYKGADAYFHSEIVHPMAEGKYLLSLNELNYCGLLSKNIFRTKVVKSIQRLEKIRLKTKDQNYLWGLSFKWNDFSAEEPFLITNCVIVDGLLSIAEKNDIPEVNAYIDKCIFSMDKYMRNNSDIYGLPLYSPNISETIFNPAIYAYSLMYRAHKIKLIKMLPNKFKSSVGLIKSNFIEGVGWPYGPTNNVIDLLHQSYIINAFIKLDSPAKEIEKYMYSCLHTFKNTILNDKAIIDSQIETLDFLTKRSPFIIKEAKNAKVIVYPNKARLWSMGEIVLCLSNLIQNSKNNKKWGPIMKKIVAEILDDNDLKKDISMTYPRQYLHLVHGLTSCISTLRMI